MDIRKAAAAPQMSLGFVDVRDVAFAHIKAMTDRRSNGHRILITNQPSLWFGDLLKMMRKEFRRQGHKRVLTDFIRFAKCDRIYL